jgi:hypothetical protein
MNSGKMNRILVHKLVNSQIPVDPAVGVRHIARPAGAGLAAGQGEVKIKRRDAGK